uniref:Uncharacterized protein n=1 Tax=Arundo donax TaxID=35708 RepID=A0A0A9AXD7_ARUDO
MICCKLIRWKETNK